MFKDNKKDTNKSKVNCCSTLVGFEHRYTLFECFYGRFLNVRYGIGSISMPITPHIHNGQPHHCNYLQWHDWPL